MIQLPPWSQPLTAYYWRLRAHRGHGSPSRSTLYRRIRAEKKRLLDAGVPAIELHLVTRLLADPSRQTSVERWRAYVAAKSAGGSPWQSS